MRQPDAIVMRGQATPSNPTDWRFAAQCRVITYTVAISLFLLILVLASRYSDLNRTEISDWRQIISLAEEASNRGDRYQARRLYLQADRVAYWRQDWEGLVAAACRINSLDGVHRPILKLFRFCSGRPRRRNAPKVAGGLPQWQNLSHCSARTKLHLQSWPESNPVGQMKR